MAKSDPHREKEASSGSSFTPEALPAEALSDLYDELRRIARRHLARSSRGVTLNTTMVVHEAYMKLSESSAPAWADRNHFLAVASRAMRQLLIDHARRRMSAKRGAGVIHDELDDNIAAADAAAEEILRVNDALEILAQHAPELEQIVECRFFTGLTVPETAAALGRSVRSVERDWARARAYLAEALGSE